ncbi:MAG: fibronectin type III domain-containing protein [Clostridia bacterium]|nr:fibronectin type III domain-containing protein [Clostridia bacterium]
MKKFLYILLAALLLATVNTAMAEYNILIAPVDEEAVVLEDVAPSVDVNVEALENVALQADAPVVNYVSGNLAHFVQPSDGDILSPGEVDILLTYDDDGVWGSSGYLLTDAEIYNNYMPTYLGITKDGHTEVIEIRNNNMTFNGTSKCYATVNLTEPGTYRLSVASHLGTSDPEVITVTVDDGSSPEPQPETPGYNPGYYLIPEQTEYTINLAYSDTACFNFRLSLYRMETDYNWGFGQSGDDVINLVSAQSNGGDIPPLREEDGRYVCDFSLVFQGTGVGTACLEIGVYVGNAEYDKHTITFHVINDPSVTPAPVNISKCAVTVKDQTYTGKALKPALTVKYGKTKLVKGTDYTVSYKNNKGAGTATVTLTGKGDYTGTRKVTFTIKPAKLSKCTFSALKDAVYSGAARKPAVTVKFGTAKLKKGTDYTVAYKNNIEVGTATVTLTGKGNFTGTKKLTFAINPKNVSISKLAAGTKQLSVQWTAREDVTGYEIEYGLNSKLKDGTTVRVKKAATAKKVIKGLKSGKKYYVRIRAYRKVGRKTYWSAWSKTKSTKVQ